MKRNEYYDLHTEAVDDLVSATKENTPRYAKAELEKYRSGKGKKLRVPEWLKAVLIKAWFYGAVCFFVFMGLGLYVGSQIDLLFIAAVVLGMVTDLLINHFLRFTEKLPGGMARWMLVTRRGAVGFFMNLVYGFVLLALVVTGYAVLSAVLGVTVGVEPLLFGLMTMGADMLCVSVKRMLMKIIADARGGKERS